MTAKRSLSPAERSLSLFVSCAPGLEPLLKNETESWMASEPTETPGGVTATGTLEDVYRLNLELGLAHAVRVRLAEFSATKFPQLVRKVARVPWEEWLGPSSQAPVQIRVTCKKSRLYHSGAVAERVKAGIEERLGQAILMGDGGLTVLARIADDQCTLSLDTSGEPLHRRGYRLATGKAPLREDLARALVVVSEWDRMTPLVDPFMGAGTIVIEAARMARRIPPGSDRRFAFMDASNFDLELWTRVHTESMSRAISELPFPIHGSDRDAGAYKSSVTNAERARVASDLHLGCAPLSAAPFRDVDLGSHGALVTNPPFGHRVGDADVRPLYQTLGRVVQGLPRGFRVALAAADPRLARATGLGLSTALLTDHGGIKVRMMTA